MAIKERKQITGTTEQINAFAGHEGTLAWDKTAKTLVGLSGVAGDNYPMATQEYVDMHNDVLTAEVNKKADTSSVYTKEEVDEKLQGSGSSFVADIPWYQRATMITANKHNIIIHAGTQITINGKFYNTQKDTAVVLPSVGNGKDVYIYACESSTDTPEFVMSTNSTVPSGYTAQNSRKIGGLHTLCADVGTISGHPLSGYTAGDILPLSLWDLKHRPVCDAEGMVWVAPINKWVQIYLPSWSGSKLESRFGGTIVDGSSAHKCNGETFAYEAGLSNCKLISRDEFVIAMRGVPEGVNINGSTDPNTTGGHTASNGVRIISNYGIEDGVGVLWQWSRDVTEFRPGATWPSDAYLSGYSWSTASIYASAYDPVSRGSCFGLLRRFLLGAYWSSGSNSGSRSAVCCDFSAYSNSGFSARLVAEPLVSL